MSGIGFPVGSPEYKAEPSVGPAQSTQTALDLLAEVKMAQLAARCEQLERALATMKEQA